MANRVIGLGRWVELGPLGAGGQGSVSKVVRAEFIATRDEAARNFRSTLSKFAGLGKDEAALDGMARRLLDMTNQYLRQPEPSDLGAFKQYNIPAGPEGEKARLRFSDELKALGQLKGTPGVIQLLDSDGDGAWMVTELYGKGTLDGHPGRYKGQALAALRALRPIVETVASLHKLKMVHRDIKTANIFPTDDDRLVLGDFGIVFFEERDKTRITESLEKVGTQDWMPPWVHTGTRLEDVPPSFDVFALAKVLWAMISGRPKLTYWFWNRQQNNLAQMFPGKPEMEIVNRRILARTLVQEPEDCLPDGAALLSALDETIHTIELGGSPLGENLVRPCRVCGRGTYEALWGSELRVAALTTTDRIDQMHDAGRLFTKGNSLSVKAFRCSHCGHVEFFHFNTAKGQIPSAWTS